MRARALLLALVWVSLGAAPFTPARARLAIAAQDVESVQAFLGRLEQTVRSGSSAAYLGLLADAADRERAGEFAAAEIRRGVTDVVLLERDREPTAEGLRIILDAFVRFGDRSRVTTWQLVLRRTPANIWAIANQERISSVDNLYRLVLTQSRQLTARDFSIRADDFELTLARGSVFTVDTEQGVTALVLVGNGTMRFHPTPAVERRQIEIYSGSEQLVTRFEAAYIRLGSVESHADMSKLTPRPVDPEAFAKAKAVFEEESSKSFAFDLSEFTDTPWTLLPAGPDFLAEVRTPALGTLTYSRSAGLPEDISFFDRVRRKNIAVYASVSKLETRGPFFSERDLAEYSVRDYDLDLTFDPARHTLDGRARLRITTGGRETNQIRLHLAPSLVVQSVTSEEYGRLFSVRVRNQDTLLVALPVLLLPDADLTITVAYSGPLDPQPAEGEMLSLSGMAQQGFEFPAQPLRLQPRDLYSSQVQWYPRPAVPDYATATIRLTVPASLDCIATGERTPESPVLMDETAGRPRQHRYTFSAVRPLRYFAFLVTKLSPIDRVAVTFPSGSPVSLVVYAHDAPDLQPKARALGGRAASVTRFYQSMAGDAPFPSLTLALLGGTQPGGHSPGYFSMLTEPPPKQPRFWKNDPAAFDTYEEFFGAHEIAHQWWGQAVGWDTYHDQWLSESFAQYFAALYVGHERGDEAFRSVMGNMRFWAMSESSQGPVFLGYRLGHVRGDTRVYRALVYDKGASVLHMLRLLVGDERFFAGIHQFYETNRFRKASTEDLRHAMEAASGRPLERFFARWIYGASLPKLRFSHRIEHPAGGSANGDLVLRVDQPDGDVFDVPVVVNVQYTDGTAADIVVAAGERTSETRSPLTSKVRRISVRDEFTLARIRR